MYTIPEIREALADAGRERRPANGSERRSDD
jgi:hypothetical protein